MELRKPVDKDWEGKIRTFNIDMRIDMPHVYDFQIVHGRKRDLARDEDLCRF